MTYPENIEKKLDFHLLRDRLHQYCQSELGREEVDDIHYHTTWEEVSALLAETDEMHRIMNDASLAFPRGEITDMRSSLARIRVEGLFLDEAELFSLKQTLSYAAELDRFFQNLDKERFPILSCLRVSGEGANLSDIVTRIDRILDKYGQMRDNASPELARIRHELTLAQGSVARAINSILKSAQQEGLIEKDTTPTMREGRLVLPVPPALRRKIGGIVHDESATGKTIYIEPQQVVEANNRIRVLQSEERRERARILVEITNEIRPQVPYILSASGVLGHIDFMRAKGTLAHELGGIYPHLHDEPIIGIHGARHPILLMRFREENREVVPLSMDLADDRHILVISGPNAGGKSVCLKTVALLQYMLQCGLLIPVDESSEVGLFTHLMIDIGDEQSLSDDLSTYSSHLRNMKQFVRTADERTLFMIDEFGSGTEPLIGGAIAESILMALNKAGAKGIVTTHYTNLKHLAEETPGLVNGAMLYDRGALRPLFQLSIGQAGSSFAIEIAHQIGLGDDIIRVAKDLIGEEHIDYDKHLQDIARDKRYWENKRQAIRQKEKHLEERIAYYEGEISGLKSKKKEMITQAQEEAANILRQSNATIERTIREIKEAKADKEKTRKAREKVEAMKQKVEQVQPVSGRKAPSTQAKPKEDGSKSKVLHSLQDLKAISKQMPSASSQVVNTIRSRKLHFDRTLDLRGYRGDEALEQLIAYMDDAVMVDAGEVTILHGTGTGALKQITRDLLQNLKRHNRIRDFHEGDVNHGGAGLTIVEI